MAGENEMLENKVFWAAFCAGLAAPIGLYATPTPYMAYVTARTLSQAFGLIGMRMTNVMGQTLDVGQPVDQSKPLESA
jgi:hypothetical protein